MQLCVSSISPLLLPVLMLQRCVLNPPLFIFLITRACHKGCVKVANSTAAFKSNARHGSTWLMLHNLLLSRQLKLLDA